MAEVSEDLKFQNLYDHYKDSFSYLRQYLDTRDRLLALILGVVIVMMFQLFSPAEAQSVISQLISQKLGLKQSIDFSFIGSVMWFLMLSLCVKYFQTVVYINNNYKYIHKLEDEISPIYKNAIFQREGKFYSDDKSLFKRWVRLLFTIILPLLLMLVLTVKIYTEIFLGESFSLIILVNGIFYLSILVSAILYLFKVHSKSTKRK
ncbi:MAG: hypothetical protein GY853_14690 [PVC group bacterium]|nr:hypothetical protein [PVC group bacterium]